jgi:hypothetical protein
MGCVMSINVVEHMQPKGDKHATYTNPKFESTNYEEPDVEQVLLYIKNINWCKQMCKVIEKASFQMIHYNDDDMQLVHNTMQLIVSKKGNNDIIKEVQQWLTLSNDIGLLYFEAVNSARNHAMRNELDIFKQKVLIFVFVVRAPLRLLLKTSN